MSEYQWFVTVISNFATTFKDLAYYILCAIT
jgi:hypothetical protein